MNINHDFNDGYQPHCQVCGSKHLKTVIDLGSQPLGDKLKKIDDPITEETSFPLIQAWCKNCGCNQLRYIVPSSLMFGDNYNYKTGVTKELVGKETISGPASPTNILPP